MAFRGHYDHSLDAKNRLSIPARFRAAFSDGLVLSQGLDTCVAVFTPQGFEAFTDSFLPDLNPLSPERRDLSRFFAGNSFEAELDSAGRITLGPALLEHAGIEKDVVVVGNVDRLEVWARERWQAEQGALLDKVRKVAEELGGHPS